MENVDFLPERIKAQRARRRRLFQQGYLLGLIAVVLVAVGYYRQGELTRASAEVATLGQCVDDLTRQAARRTNLESQLQDLNIKKRVEEHLGSRISAQLVLAELQRQLPATVSLSKLEIDTFEIQPGIKDSSGHVSARAVVSGNSDPVKPETVKRVRLCITGMAPTDVDVANFIGQLSASPLFEEVTMGYSRNVVVQGHVAREFRATCNVAK